MTEKTRVKGKQYNDRNDQSTFASFYPQKTGTRYTEVNYKNSKPPYQTGCNKSKDAPLESSKINRIKANKA